MELASAMDYGLNQMQDDEFKIWVYKARRELPHRPACARSRHSCAAGAAQNMSRGLARSYGDHGRWWLPGSAVWRVAAQPGAAGRAEPRSEPRRAILSLPQRPCLPLRAAPQILPCPNRRQHDWKRCPLAHDGGWAQESRYRALRDARAF